jgi:hypothetical protein
VVERERALDPVFGQFSPGEDVPGVVDEYIEVVVAGLDVLGDVADLLLRFEVGEDQIGDASAVRRACDLIAGGGAAAGVSAQQHEVGAGGCVRGREADAVAGSGDETVLPCIGDVVDDMMVS